MGKGLDKVARSLLDLQPTAVLDLFLLYPDYQKFPNEFYPIHNGSVLKKGIIWQGVTYMPVGMEIDGFEINADGRINRPKIRISNKDYYVTNLLRRSNDFKNGKIIRKRTFVKFLDDENFDGGNPFGEADNTAELSSQEYIIAQKVQENKVIVELELTSPLDLDNFEINHRRIMGKYCYWQYRGNGCQYRGVPIHREDGSDFTDINGNFMSFNGGFVYGDNAQKYRDDVSYTTGDLAWIKNERIKVIDPYGVQRPLDVLNYYIAKTDVRGLRPDENPKYWEKDGCNKKLSSCKLRFTEEKTITRFVGVQQVVTGISSLSGYGTYDYYFEPEDDTSLRQALSGENWTFMFLTSKYKNDHNYAGYLSSNQNRYGGINMFEYDRRIRTSYRSVNDSSKNIAANNKMRDIKSYNTNQTLNYPFIMRKVSANTIQLIEYNADSKTSITHAGDVISGTHNRFIIGRSWDSYKRSPSIEVEGFFFWNKDLTDEDIDLLFRSDSNFGHRIRPYNELKNGNQQEKDLVNNSCLGWWTFPFDDATGQQKGINNYADPTNNLIYKQGIPEVSYGQHQDFLKEDTYLYNLEETVDQQEVVSYLPFGGFPGTDGYSFDRKV